MSYTARALEQVVREEKRTPEKTEDIMKKRLAILTVTVVGVLGLAGSAFAGARPTQFGGGGGSAPGGPTTSTCGHCM
jgi:hypothetical protein